MPEVTSSNSSQSSTLLRLLAAVVLLCAVGEIGIFYVLLSERSRSVPPPTQVNVEKMQGDVARLQQKLDEIERTKVVAVTPVPAEPGASIVAGEEFAFKMPRLKNDLFQCGQVEFLGVEAAKELGLSKYFQSGYQTAAICQQDDGRIGAILYKTKAGNCVDSCDEDLFITMDQKTGTGYAQKLTVSLGIVSESYNQYCAIDHVGTAKELKNDELYFVCGSGESGGYSHWYRYAFADNSLHLVQQLKVLGSGKTPDTYTVLDQLALKKFSMNSNQAMGINQ